MLQSRHDAESYRRVEVITGGRRRRNWSDDEKARIVAESADPDANVSEVARRNGVSRGLLTTWRRQARALATPKAFARVQIAAAPEDVAAALRLPANVDKRCIEIVLCDATVRVPAGADAQTLATVFAALRSAR
jgi:transposase